jgi:hypothetical protein
MANDGNLFAVSVGDCIGRNRTTKQVYFYGKANVETGVTTAMDEVEVRGGINNPKLYSYFHSRKINASITSAVFDQTWLALNAGATAPTNGTTTITRTEAITLTSGCVGTLTGSALAGTQVGIILSGGSIINLAAAGSTVTVPGQASATVTATYDCSGSNINYVTGYSITPPSNVELLIQSEIRDSSNNKLYLHQYIIPSYQITGNQQLALTANGVSQTKLDGTALSISAAGGDYFYIERVIPA